MLLLDFLLLKKDARYKIISTVYLLVIYCFITKFVVDYFGYKYQSNIDITYKTVFTFLNSPAPIVIILSFISTYLIISQVIVHIVPLLLHSLIITPLEYLFRGIIWCFGKLKNFKNKRILPKVTSLIIDFKCLVYKNDKYYKGANYDIFKKYIQDLNSGGELIKNIRLTFELLVATTLILVCYNLQILIFIKLKSVFIWVTVYISLNLIFYELVLLNIDEFVQMMLDAEINDFTVEFNIEEANN